MGGDRWAGDEGKGGGKGGRWKHAFKVLCPETLVSSIMGARGAAKDQIQDETNCKLVVSGRDEYFAGTRLRVLVILSYTAEGILPALDKVVDKIVELGEQERSNSSARPAEPDFLGKEPGEYMLRSIILPKMSGAVIGTRGANVQSIREESNAKVFIENAVFQGHQVMKLVASSDGMRIALARINGFIQLEAEPGWLFEWATVKGGDANAAEVTPAPAADRHARDQRWSEPGHHDKTHARDRERSPRRGNDLEVHHNDEREHHGIGSHLEVDRGPGTQVGPSLADDPALLQGLAATASDFPESTLDVEVTVTCDLPSQKVGALIGTHGKHIESVRQESGTKVHFEQVQDEAESQQTMVVKGPLLRVFRAHALMMRRYHEVEAEAKRPEPPPPPKEPSVRDLQEQLANLQKQLDVALKPQAGKGTTSLSGGKGKGKSKRRA